MKFAQTASVQGCQSCRQAPVGGDAHVGLLRMAQIPQSSGLITGGIIPEANTMSPLEIDRVIQAVQSGQRWDVDVKFPMAGGGFSTVTGRVMNSFLENGMRWTNVHFAAGKLNTPGGAATMLRVEDSSWNAARPASVMTMKSQRPRMMSR